MKKFISVRHLYIKPLLLTIHNKLWPFRIYVLRTQCSFFSKLQTTQTLVQRPYIWGSVLWTYRGLITWLTGNCMTWYMFIQDPWGHEPNLLDSAVSSTLGVSMRLRVVYLALPAAPSKGQIILKGLFVVFNWTKNTTKLFYDFCPSLYVTRVQIKKKLLPYSREF